jgi:hypothetical protein
VFH